MKKEIISIIKIAGVGIKELVMDITIGESIYNSIELVGIDSVILHYFIKEVDIEINWDDIPEENQKKIIETLRPYVYN